MHEEGLLRPSGSARRGGRRHAFLVGHSDGGSIALIHAAHHPERVCALVLEAPHVFVEDVAVESIARAAEEYRTTDLRTRLARWHGDNVDGAFWGWNRVWLDPAFRDWSLVDLLPAVRAPTLVLQGEADEYGTVAQVEAIRRGIAGPVETHVLPDCGHAPHRDRPDDTLRAMRSFLRRTLDR